MNIKYLVSTVIVASALSASASQIQFGTGGSRGHMFVTNSGTRLPDGSLVRVGYLGTPDNLSTFTEFATTTISFSGLNPPFSTTPGFLSKPAENLVQGTTGAPGSANAAKNKQIYLWVYNATTAAAATEQGIFTSTDLTWIFPTFTGAADEFNTTPTGLSLGAGVVTAASPPLEAVKPGWVAPTSTKGTISINNVDNTNGSIYKLGAIIPEPGTAGLVLLSVLGLARRRR